MGATGACGCPPPTSSPAALGRARGAGGGAGPAGTGVYQTQVPEVERVAVQAVQESTDSHRGDWIKTGQVHTEACEPGAANVRAPVNVRRRVRVRAARRG